MDKRDRLMSAILAAEEHAKQASAALAKVGPEASNMMRARVHAEASKAWAGVADNLVSVESSQPEAMPDDLTEPVSDQQWSEECGHEEQIRGLKNFNVEALKQVNMAQRIIVRLMQKFNLDSFVIPPDVWEETTQHHVEITRTSDGNHVVRWR